MASEKNVIIQGGDDENLHTMMEVLEGISARTKELGDVGSEVDELKGAIQRLSDRCDQLDKELPQGQKVFAAETPVKDSALREFGGQISQAWRLKQFGRAGGAAGNDGDEATAGSVLVPQITYDKVARIVEEASIIRNIATVVPMSSNTMVMPTRSSGPSVSWLANQGIDSATKTSVVFENNTLTSKTLMAIDEVSAELDEDSIVALEPFFAQMFAEAVGKEENKQAFNASTPFTGVSNDSNITSVEFSNDGQTFGEVTHADLVNAQYTADPKVIHKGTWIMHPDAFKECIGLKDSNGRPIYASAWYGGGPSTGAAQPNEPIAQQAQASILLGRPAYLTETMPTTAASAIFAVFGDFSKFAFGDRKQMTIDWSDQVYYEYGNLALRVRERIALKTLITGAFARLAVGNGGN